MLSSSSSEETSNSHTTTTSTTTNTTRSQSLSQSQLAPNTSSSSASSSSLKSLISLINAEPSPPRTMEEVWKDINLSSLSETPSLHQHQQIRTHHRPSATGFRPNQNIFQDFLARPFGNEPQIPPQQQPQTRKTMNHNMAYNLSTPITSNTTPTIATTKAKNKASKAALFSSLNPSSSSCSSPSSPTIPTNNPVTALSLNSGPEFRFLDSPVETLIRPNNTDPISNMYSLTDPFEGLACSSGKKRFPSLEDASFTSNSSGGDRRHKRMIKNRESAARSRARKQERDYLSNPLQAYTSELELAVKHLTEENARLRKQQEQHRQAATAHQLPKKHSLQRTSTAPF